MTNPTSLICSEELLDSLQPCEYPSTLPEYSPDILYYNSLLVSNLSPPVIPYLEARVELINWVLKVSANNLMSRETAHVAIVIFDKTLCVTTDHRSHNLLLIAMSALMLASKFIEKKPIHIKALNQHSDYQFSQKDIIKTELKCLKACNFKIPSITLAKWLDFLTTKWDQFIASHFFFSNFIDFNDVTRLNIILFRQPDVRSYKRIQKVYALCDLVCLNKKVYAFDHRMLAFAILWKVVFWEFVVDNRDFYKNCAWPGASVMFGVTERICEKSANDWIFELLMGFTRVYVEEDPVELAGLFEFVDRYLEVLPGQTAAFEKYLKKTEPEERHYEYFLGLQTYSASYIKTSRSVNN